MKARKIIWGLITAALSLSAAAQETKVLTLDQARALGLEKATQVLKSNNNVRITGAQLMYAYGQFLPDLGFNAGYTYNAGRNLFTAAGLSVIDSRQNLLNYQLVSTINIFNGLSDYSQLKAAMLTKSSAGFNLDRAKQQISLDVAQSYLQVVLDRRVEEAARENLNASLQREAQLREQANVGRRALVDLYQQQALTSSDSLFYIQSQTKAKNDKILLLRKVLIAQTDAYDIADYTPSETSSGIEGQNINDLVSQGIGQRPDLKAAQNQIMISEWNIRQYRSGFMPKLNLIAGVVSNGGYLDRLYVNGSDYLATHQQEPLGQALFGQVYGTVGLNLSWRIFDKGLTKTSVDIARINRDNARIDEADLEVQISSDIRQAYNDYLAALAQISTTNTGLYAASQAYEAVKGRYDLGAANFVELSNAQATLLQARINKAQAAIKLDLQKNIIDYYVGK